MLKKAKDLQRRGVIHKVWTNIGGNLKYVINNNRGCPVSMFKTFRDIEDLAKENKVGDETVGRDDTVTTEQARGVREDEWQRVRRSFITPRGRGFRGRGRATPF